MPINVALRMAVISSGRLQIEIAKACRIHETRLSKIVRGHVEPTDKEKLLLAMALGAAPDVLFATVDADDPIASPNADDQDQLVLPLHRKAAVTR